VVHGGAKPCEVDIDATSIARITAFHARLLG
jgi:hypothetical protein